MKSYRGRNEVSFGKRSVIILRPGHSIPKKESQHHRKNGWMDNRPALMLWRRKKFFSPVGNQKPDRPTRILVHTVCTTRLLILNDRLTYEF